MRQTGQDDRNSRPGLGAPSPGHLLTTAQVAAQISVDPVTIRRWVAKGCPVALRLADSKQYRFDLRSVMEWAARGTGTKVEWTDERKEIFKVQTASAFEKFKSKYRA